jgi:RNA polymerase sigma-70 factor, ECF subfamily
MSDPGRFEARYLAFLETVRQLRPSLHRYCARMIGSVLDGEDVVQDALFQAYRKLDTFEDGRPLGPWLFRIAHNRCIDYLRQNRVRLEAESHADVADVVAPHEPNDPAVPRAIEHLVLTLPPKERACVLLKDVFSYSLDEIAELVDSTVGGVKAALNRGRAKLASAPLVPAAERRAAESRGANPLLELYVDRFNRRDWDGVRELIAADARVRVADRFVGPLTSSPYFGVYQRRTSPWRLAPGTVDGATVLLVFGGEEDASSPEAIVRVLESDGRIVRIDDYTHCPWILSAAGSITDSTSARELGVSDRATARYFSA